MKSCGVLLTLLGDLSLYWKKQSIYFWGKKSANELALPFRRMKRSFCFQWYVSLTDGWTKLTRGNLLLTTKTFFCTLISFSETYSCMTGEILPTNHCVNLKWNCHPLKRLIIQMSHQRDRGMWWTKRSLSIRDPRRTKIRKLEVVVQIKINPSIIYLSSLVFQWYRANCTAEW